MFKFQKENMPEIKEINEYINTKTVIIGAGVSGISTAIDLLKNNYDEFLIFEALSYVGGRCRTINYDNSFLEIGAQYIHGQIDNPIYYIARDNKQLEEKYNKIYFNEDDKNEDNNGVCIDISLNDDDEAQVKYMFTTQFGKSVGLNEGYELYNLINKLIVDAKNYSSDEHNKLELKKKDINVGEFIKNRLNLILENGLKIKLSETLDENELRKLIYGFLVWRCKCENMEVGCHTVCDVSLKNYSSLEDTKGLQIIESKFGYTSIIDSLIGSNKDEFNSRLKLNTPLQKILLCKKSSEAFDKNDQCEHCLYTNDHNKVALLFNNENSNLKKTVVICDNVVCTMSNGYLKENLQKIIQPSSFIPKEKQLAISRIGYGTVNKIFMVYDEPWWHEDLEGIHCIWIKEDDSEDYLEQTRNFTEDNWYENIAYFETVNNQSHVLSAWLSGCEFFEKFSDEKIANDCVMVLKKMLNNDNIPLPNSIIRSKWNSDEYFKGSYTFIPMNSDVMDLKIISKPIELNKRPVVMFAGEGTSHNQFSTTHGAYNSGLRESNRILSTWSN